MLINVMPMEGSDTCKIRQIGDIKSNCKGADELTVIPCSTHFHVRFLSSYVS